jgi:hypothetical protein
MVRLAQTTGKKTIVPHRTTSFGLSFLGISRPITALVTARM